MQRKAVTLKLAALDAERLVNVLEGLTQPVMDDFLVETGVRQADVDRLASYIVTVLAAEGR